MAQPASQRLTIRQIADLAGVSIATVSRVLNGRDDVADETRDLVTRVIRENGYTANRSARGLSAGRPGSSAILVPLVYPGVLLRHPCRRRRGALRAGPADRALADRPRARPRGSVLDRLHGVTDGALIILPEESSEELERLLDRGYRFVVLDPLMPLDERIPSVSAAHMPPAPTRRCVTCSISATGGSRRSPARAAGWRPRTVAAAIAPRLRPRGSCPTLRSRSSAIPEIGLGVRREVAARPPRSADGDLRLQRQHRDRRMQAARARGLRVPEDLRSSASTTSSMRRS